MKVRTQIVRIAGGGVLLGRRGRVKALPESHSHTMSVFGRQVPRGRTGGSIPPLPTQ
jgi:hypothetical protein